MNRDQARGYAFEKIIQELLARSGYYKLETGTIKGRGAYHQIDAYGIFSYPVPYIYPIRIISEAKCYKNNKVELPHIRNFVGVMKDICECYFMINGEGNQEKRYNDIGCYFSYSDFTKDAQEYAWAQNIFLVSFYKNVKIRNIVNKIDSVLKDYTVDKKINLSKEEVVNIVERDVFGKNFQINMDYTSPTVMGLRDTVNLVSLAIGVLNNRYPVILVGPKDWDKRIPILPHTDSIRVYKNGRKDEDDSSRFYLQLNADDIEFNLPKSIRDYLISIINCTESGKCFCSIDLPVIDTTLNNKDNKKGVRRILSLEIEL